MSNDPIVVVGPAPPAPVVVVTAPAPPALVTIAAPGTVPGAQGEPGPPGPAGEPGLQPVMFTGTWSSFSTAHAFPYLPPVLVVDAGGRPVETDVEYPDPTHVAITFPAPFTASITIG